MFHLRDDEIAELLDLASVTEAVEGAFAAWGRGDADTTQRVRSSAGGGVASAMAAVVPPFSGGKVYSTASGAFTFVNILFDIEGRLLCTLDGDALTRYRTPAACAVAIRALAAPACTTAALIGAGRQGWYHLEMLASELPALSGVAIHDLRPEAAEAMVERARAAGISATVASSPTDAVRDADVIVTVTQSTAPLFAADAVSDRALICAVGATKYDRCEIGADVIERCASVVCDDVTGSRVECGDLIQAAHAGRFDWSRAIELSAVAAGIVDVPRAGTTPVLFETQGVALQDVAAAALAYQRSRRKTPKASDNNGDGT
ncbi:MAG: ornithine cyclodeaminase [Acidimicrobiaceae bacterium]|nr:MAG: ornithine cyclodeaminase [Acidimicrobiaceae bacterium]